MAVSQSILLVPGIGIIPLHRMLGDSWLLLLLLQPVARRLPSTPGDQCFSMSE
jgi:hypothetical protein